MFLLDHSHRRVKSCLIPDLEKNEPVQQNLQKNPGQIPLLPKIGSNMAIREMEHAVSHQRKLLVDHPVYSSIKDIEGIRIFMERHVFAVWDFMSLLKTLQSSLTCVGSPWLPVGNPETRYLINEIVTGEESDVDENGNRTSHFELYIRAMEQADADTGPISSFINALQNGNPLVAAISSEHIPKGASHFMRSTFDTISTGKIHAIAAVFTFGREDLIPDMFLRLIDELKQKFPDRLDILHYYIQRHIEVDGGHHSEMARRMTMELCGDDPVKWEEAIAAVTKTLEARHTLWDSILAEL